VSETRLSLIRFVTARQTELRGLREAVFCVGACANMALILWSIEFRPRYLGALSIVLFWIFWMEGVVRFVNRRYDSKYGRVASHTYRRAPGSVGQTLLAAGAMLDVFVPAFPFAGHSAFLILVAAYAAWIAWRDFPWRGYYLAAVFVAFIATPVDDPSRMISYFPAYAAGLAAIALMGLLDHVLLMTAFARLRRTCAEGASRRS
jgi:hypothetical protein